MRVHAAADGSAALQALEGRAESGEPFRLLLTDAQMPEMHGFEATEAIRAKEKETGGHIPIIAMTAHVMKGDEERCLRAGMDGYVAKPIQPLTLFAAIEAQATRVPIG
jgi:CheY-like chemotaxis protein